MADHSKRGQCLYDGKPNLKVKSSVRGCNHVGHPVPEGARGTVYQDRNPMHDKEPPSQMEGKDPIRAQLILKGVR